MMIVQAISLILMKCSLLCSHGNSVNLFTCHIFIFLIFVNEVMIARCENMVYNKL